MRNGYQVHAFNEHERTWEVWAEFAGLGDAYAWASLKYAQTDAPIVVKYRKTYPYRWGRCEWRATPTALAPQEGCAV